MENLVREAVKPLQLVEIDMAEKVLADRALRELGYRPFADEIDKKMQAVTKANYAEIFKKLGIEPFSKESVEKYKAEMLRKANFSGVVREAMSEDLGAALFFGGAIAVIIAFVIVGVESFVAHKALAHFSRWWWAVPASLTSIPIVVWNLGTADQYIKQYSWKSEFLKNYTGKVPAFALSRALELKQALPAAWFEVESLVYKDVYLDPFLVLRVGEDRFYIDVWDEPKFEGRRIK